MTTDSPPTWASGRQASHVSAAVEAEASRGRPRAAPDRVVGEHDPLGRPVEPLVATTSASPASTGRAPSSAASRRQRRRSLPGAARRAARPWPAPGTPVEHQCGVTVVPDPSQRLDEARAAREVDRHQPVHGRQRIDGASGCAASCGSVLRCPHLRAPATNKWVLGARPRTLPAAVVPVALGTACRPSGWARRSGGGRRRRSSSASPCRSA